MIELIFLDVDGCLTDGGIIYTSEGKFIQKFNVKDGAAIEAWLKLGKQIAIITGRTCPCVKQRAEDLKISILKQGVRDKLACAEGILRELGLSFEQCAAIGDYYNDQALLEAVALSFKPKDACEDLAVDVRLGKKGGCGAVAQMIESIIQKDGLKAQWDELWR